MKSFPCNVCHESHVCFLLPDLLFQTRTTLPSTIPSIPSTSRTSGTPPLDDLDPETLRKQALDSRNTYSSGAKVTPPKADAEDELDPETLRMQALMSLPNKKVC